MNNFVTQTLFNQLQLQLRAKNPKGFQTFQDFMNSGGNPETFAMQVLGNFSPEQRQELLKQAKSYGCPDSILSQIQNMK